MNKHKVLVTGGAGFIGSHLVDYLIDEGCEVTVIDNLSTGRVDNLAHRKEDIQLVKADIADFDAILPYFKGKEIVFHLAALADIVPSIVTPRNYYTSNVLGTMCVVEAARLSGVNRFVYAASSSCYGIPPDGFYPTSETAPISPQYPYALTKYLGEQTVLHWGQVYDIPVVSLRLFNVYGLRSRISGTYGAVFGVFLAQRLNNKPYTVVGDGSQTRDFIYVTDAVEAFVRAGFSTLVNEVFNVGSGSSQSINKLVSLLEGDKVHIPKRPGEPECTWADISKIRRMLDWEPKVSFEEGTKKMLENIDYWRDAPAWTPEKITEATREWFKCLAKE